MTKGEIPEDFLKSQIATLNENGNKRGLHIKNCHMHLRARHLLLMSRTPVTFVMG